MFKSWPPLDSVWSSKKAGRARRLKCPDEPGRGKQI
jgi:hypothetical protein